MSADTSILPPEVTLTPQPLIGLCGLDMKNPIHKSIWDAFNTNRKSDRVSIQFTIIPNNYEFPVSKPKRQSYEWYQPKGILKRNWLIKHLNVLPAVIVLFQDMEWNDPLWSDKLLQCASLMQSLKNSLQRRNTRLVIVLLQKGAPLPPGEDLLATERAANLTSVCDINAKMLFILPHNDHLMGYTLRLESAFLELAQTYYAQMAKQVRVHRDQLTSSHLTLLIRHHFKLGFISEMRLDYSTALKHYTQAYSNLEDIRVVDTNCLEIKTVASYLNYKMCRLLFKLNVPRDAITQFKTHMERYRNRSGFKDLLFEHYAWMSIQYSSFAELFCEAIKNGLPALQTQHPGIYFHKAAEYIAKRKETFLQCSAHSLSPIESLDVAADMMISNDLNSHHQQPSMNNIFQNEFVGVRSAKLTNEPITEQQIINIVQADEKQFNHSMAIIALLSQAMAQFKFYKCLRFRKKLAIDMAEEYLKCGDYSKALTLYSLMLSDYRMDKWYTIFSEVLLKTLRASYLSASVTDFVTCSIEAISPIINIENSERMVLMENLWKVFQNVPPISQSQIAPELRTNWELALANFKSPVLIDLDKINSLFECVVTFRKSQVRLNEPIQLDLFIRSKACIPLKIRDFTIIFCDSKLQFKLKATKYTEITVEYLLELNKRNANAVNKDNFIIDSANTNTNNNNGNNSGENVNIPDDGSENDQCLLLNNDFMLEPDKYYRILFHIDDYQFTENAELNLTKLELTMGELDKQYAILQQSIGQRQPSQFKNYNRKCDCMENISVYNSCYIIPIFHLTIQNNLENQPMLVNEYFKVNCIITNPYDIGLRNVGISIMVPLSLKNKVYLTSDVKLSNQKLVSQLQIDIGDVQAMQSNTSISYYLISLFEGNIDLIQKIHYQIEQQNSHQSKPKAIGNKIENAIDKGQFIVEAISITTPTSSSSSTSTSSVIMGGTTEIVGSTGISQKNLRNTKQLQQQLHNINIDNIEKENSIRKLKEDIIIIPCIEEFNVVGKFYSLNHKSLTRAFRNEDFLLRIDIEIKSTICDIEILDMYFLCDHNLSEKSTYNKQRRKYSNNGMNIKKYAIGQQIRDIKMLRANQCTMNWINKNDYLLKKSSKQNLNIFHRKQSTNNNYKNMMDNKKSTDFIDNQQQQQQQADYFKTNLLSKIPINSTIIGNSTNDILLSTTTISQQQQQQQNMNKSDDNLKLTLKNNTNTTIGNVNPNDINLENSLVNTNTNNNNNSNNNIKYIYNKSMDAFLMTEHCKGFLKGKTGYELNSASSSPPPPIFGVYCIKWRRHGFIDENESKFIIDGIEIIEPPLNLYCYIEDKMYVKIPMTLKIMIVNPTRSIMNLIVTLKNSENFMFSGHTQLNITILSNSSYELSFNLYPLKPGWQTLPELEMKYSSSTAVTTNQQQLNSNSNTNNTQMNVDEFGQTIDHQEENNLKLQQLIKRWMPKKVFILPMLRHTK